MGFSRDGGGGRRPLAEINITPLVDVMLVLLIIFMVTAPMIENGVKVELPKVKAPSVQSSDTKLVLAITQDRRIFLANEEVPLEQLGAKLKANAQLAREHELYVHADRSLEYGVVLEVMALAQESGVESLGMVTDPAEVKR